MDFSIRLLFLRGFQCKNTQRCLLLILLKQTGSIQILIFFIMLKIDEVNTIIYPSFIFRNIFRLNFVLLLAAISTKTLSLLVLNKNILLDAAFVVGLYFALSAIHRLQLIFKILMYKIRETSSILSFIKYSFSNSFFSSSKHQFLRFLQLIKDQKSKKSRIHKQYYIGKAQMRKQSQQFKQSLFQYCWKEAYVYDLKLEKKLQLREQLKQLAGCVIPEQQVKIQIKKISLKYSVKQHLAYQQMNRIRKGSIIKMQTQLTAYQNALNHFKYYRVKYNTHSPTEIWQILAKQHSIKSADRIRWSFDEQMERIYSQQRQNYLKICSKIILDKLSKGQIIFIDFFQFYRAQFILWNQLSKKNMSPDYKINAFNPCDDTIYHVIL